MKKRVIATLIIAIIIISSTTIILNQTTIKKTTSKNHLTQAEKTTTTKNVSQQEKSKKPIFTRTAKLSDITFEKDKINIYFFWGDGCPHCEELFTFLESIKDEYNEYFNLYGFEVWYNEDNGKIMDYFQDKLGETVGSRSVPYYIIGDKSFAGYTSSMNEEILDTIKEKYNNRQDIKNFEGVLDLNE